MPETSPGGHHAASEPLRPLVSVILEGYNQSRDLGQARDTLAALARQDYPTDRIEVILVGSAAQGAEWRDQIAGHPFHDVRVLTREDINYYGLKNEGALTARGEIIAMSDSDVQPEPTWVSAIVEAIEGGADAVAGPSLFAGSGLAPYSPLMICAAAVTWGWICGPRGPDGRMQPRGFMDHNVALRADVARDHHHRTDLGRILASPLLFRQLQRAGKTVVMHPRQRSAHQFSWRYWLINLEFRYGHEVYRLRRLDPGYPNRWLMRFGWLEPLATFFWHLGLDVPKWFRFTGLLDMGLARRLLLFPLFMAMSVVARLSEMVGMYATMAAPEPFRQWAETS